MHRGSRYCRYIYTAKAHQCDRWMDRVKHALWALFHPNKHEGYGRVDPFGACGAGYYPAFVPQTNVTKEPLYCTPLRGSRTLVVYDLLVQKNPAPVATVQEKKKKNIA